MRVYATITTVDDDTESKQFSGWPAMLAYITENWKTIKEFSAHVQHVQDMRQGRADNG